MDLNLLRKKAKERVKVELVGGGIGIYREELKAEIRFNIWHERVYQPAI